MYTVQREATEINILYSVLGSGGYTARLVIHPGGALAARCHNVNTHCGTERRTLRWIFGTLLYYNIFLLYIFFIILLYFSYLESDFFYMIYIQE